MKKIKNLIRSITEITKELSILARELTRLVSDIKILFITSTPFLIYWIDVNDHSVSKLIDYLMM